MLTAAVSGTDSAWTALSEACSGPCWACSTAQSGGVVSVSASGDSAIVCRLVSGPSTRVYWDHRLTSHHRLTSVLTAKPLIEDADGGSGRGSSMGSKTLIGGALSMRFTPLGPWEVGASVGPAGAGLHPPGSYGRVAKPYWRSMGSRSGGGKG